MICAPPYSYDMAVGKYQNAYIPSYRIMSIAPYNRRYYIRLAVGNRVGVIVKQRLTAGLVLLRVAPVPVSPKQAPRRSAQPTIILLKLSVLYYCRGITMEVHSHCLYTYTLARCYIRALLIVYVLPYLCLADFLFDVLDRGCVRTQAIRFEERDVSLVERRRRCFVLLVIVVLLIGSLACPAVAHTSVQFAS